LVDRPSDSGQGQGKGQPQSKEGGGGRGKRRRRKPDGAKPDPSQVKEGGADTARHAGGRGPGRQQARGRNEGGAVPRHQGGRPPKANGNAAPRRGQTAPAVKPTPKVEKPDPPFQHVLRRYGLAIYETHQAAKADRLALLEQAKTVDQLNIVIRAEGSMDDPELTSIGNVKVFAGTAWALIHDRRVADGWYNEAR